MVLKPSEIAISVALLASAAALVLFGMQSGGGGVAEVEGRAANDVVAESGSEAVERIEYSEPSVWQRPRSPSHVISDEAPVLFSQAAGPASGDDLSGCRYWNVLRPADDALASFWIGGWVLECDGVMGPVVPLGPRESIEEVYLRLENALAEIDRLQQRLEAVE